MELLYEVKPDFDGAEDYVVSSKRMKLALTPQRRPLVAVSVRNLIAFSSYADLSLSPKSKSGRASASNCYSNNSSGGNGGSGGESEIAGAHVYVADLNTPWETYLVKNSQSHITHLQWDHPGAKLIVGTADGQVEVYTMVDHLLNKWQVSYGCTFPGEPIVASCWLGLPRKVTLNPDKMDSIVYSEKYSVSVLPSTRGFGGKSLDGCVIVTATGLLGALVSSGCEDLSKPITATEKMVAVRNQIMFADMAYSKDGDIVIVTCNSNLKQPVLVNRIKVGLVGCGRDKAEIKATASQSLFLPFLADHSISSVNFISKTSTDSLLVSLINQSTGSSWLCLYELVVQPVALKSRFQTSSNELINTYRWQQTSQVQFGCTIAAICTLPLQLTSSSNAFGSGSGSSMQNSLQNQSQQTTATMTQSLIAASLSNGCVILARCDNLQQVGSINPSQTAGSNVSSGLSIKRERDDMDSKPANTGCRFSGSKGTSNAPETHDVFVSLGFSWSGSVLVALSSNSLINVYKIHPNIDASTATTLIELSMMGGLDPWDVMMCVRSNLIENITDRLSETFARQPQSVQTHYNARILVVKAALYRLASSGTARINDQQTLLTLYMVSGALKALLRPSDLSSHDKGPAESLSSLLGSKGEALSDVDKVLVHVVAKEYAVEPSTLQSLQQFLQWCADLALKLLATLPDLRHSRAPGWEVCRDSKAVGTLRELIVLMRIWGLINPSCLPSFRKTSENLDVLPLLFRLLTRLSVAPHDPDESLMDECCLLPSEVQIPTYNAYSPSKSLGVASSVIFSRGSPHQFQYGVNPLKWWIGVESNGNWMDGLRLLWLGKNPSGVKVCNRCGCSTLTQLPARSAANKAWDQRWLRSCPCGGHWKIPSYLPQPKVVDTDPFLNF